MLHTTSGTITRESTAPPMPAHMSAMQRQQREVQQQKMITQLEKVAVTNSERAVKKVENIQSRVELQRLVAVANNSIVFSKKLLESCVKGPLYIIIDFVYRIIILILLLLCIVMRFFEVTLISFKFNN